MSKMEYPWEWGGKGLVKYRVFHVISFGRTLFVLFWPLLLVLWGQYFSRKSLEKENWKEKEDIFHKGEGWIYKVCAYYIYLCCYLFYYDYAFFSSRLVAYISLVARIHEVLAIIIILLKNTIILIHGGWKNH